MYIKRERERNSIGKEREPLLSRGPVSLCCQRVVLFGRLLSPFKSSLVSENEATRRIGIEPPVWEKKVAPKAQGGLVEKPSKKNERARRSGERERRGTVSKRERERERTKERGDVS